MCPHCIAAAAVAGVSLTASGLSLAVIWQSVRGFGDRLRRIGAELSTIAE